jgi:hypothetical protein
MSWPFLAFGAFCKWEIVLNTVAWEAPFNGCCSMDSTPLVSRAASLSVAAPLLISLMMAFAVFSFQRQSFMLIALTKKDAANRVEQLGREKQRLDFERMLLESRLRSSQVQKASLSTCACMKG